MKTPKKTLTGILAAAAIAGACAPEAPAVETLNFDGYEVRVSREHRNLERLSDDRVSFGITSPEGEYISFGIDYKKGAGFTNNDEVFIDGVWQPPNDSTRAKLQEIADWVAQDYRRRVDSVAAALPEGLRGLDTAQAKPDTSDYSR